MIPQRNKKKFFLGLDQKFKKSMVEKNCFMKKKNPRIGVNTDDDLPINKSLNFPMLTTIIRSIFQDGEKLYLQIYLDECLYELV